MASVTRKWDLLPKEKRDGLVREISSYFATEHDLDIGTIASEDVLDFFLREIGKEVYNRGVEDTREVLREGFGNLEVNVDLLLRK